MQAGLQFLHEIIVLKELTKAPNKCFFFPMLTCSDLVLESGLLFRPGELIKLDCWKKYAMVLESSLHLTFFLPKKKKMNSVGKTSEVYVTGTLAELIICTHELN